MEINGLPLHPLAVHAAVVFGPLAGLVGLAYLVPKWRDRLRWPMLWMSLIAAVAMLMAYLSGNSFRDANSFFTTPPSEVTEQIDDHERLGTITLWWTFGLAVSAGLNAWLHERTGWVRYLLGAFLLVDAIAVIVLVILTGDSGARAVWDSFSG